MSTATVDPTLEALVPRGSAWRNTVLVVLGLALLAAAWFLPPVARPSIGTASGASWREFAAARQVVLVAGLEPRTPAGLQVRAVEDVPGAHVVAAWATDDRLEAVEDAAAATPEGRGLSASDYAAALGVTDADRLPRTVAPDGDATLVVLWQLDDCTALTGQAPVVVAGSRWGVTAHDSLGFSPFSVYVGAPPDPASPCS